MKDSLLWLLEGYAKVVFSPKADNVESKAAARAVKVLGQRMPALTSQRADGYTVPVECDLVQIMQVHITNLTVSMYTSFSIYKALVFSAF